jgi:4-amino-4-deoxy-L-arabinose transferase-like glycosyltransferase
VTSQLAPAPVAPTPGSAPEDDRAPRFSARGALLALAAIIAAGATLRFASLGLQSYHHDEVITAMRVIPGTFTEMLDAVRTSESNPPLYYVLAWAWAKLLGTGEVGLRSLSAVFGTATVALGYPIGRELANRRTGLILAAMLAVNPMLIWYSQEARSYAPLVFFAGLSLLFFLRALRSQGGRDLGFWALASALALCSHYFAVFPLAIEAAWLLVALRSRWRVLLPAVAAVLATGLALLPLITAQVNPDHIGWIENSPLSSRFLETGVSFLIGETGHVIAEPPRDRYGQLPAVAIALALLLAFARGSSRQRRGAALCLALGSGVVALTALAALLGHDYVVERNLLPALLPLAAAAAIGFGAEHAHRLGLLLAVALCAYWLAFDIHVTRTPNLQRPDFRTLTGELGEPGAHRAIVSWKLAADPVRWYLRDHSLRMYGGQERVSEIDVVSKPVVAAHPVTLPPSFRIVQRFRLDRLTLTRYLSKRPMPIAFHTLRDLPTGFGEVGVVIDSPPSQLAELGAEARTTPSSSAEAE